MVGTDYYAFVKTQGYIILRVNSNINYELWMIMLYKYRFIDCNKCTTVVYNIKFPGEEVVCGK